MTEAGAGIDGGHLGESLANRIDEGNKGAGPHAAQIRFQEGQYQLDWIEIGGVGGQLSALLSAHLAPAFLWTLRLSSIIVWPSVSSGTSHSRTHAAYNDMRSVRSLAIAFSAERMHRDIPTP